MSYLVRKLYKRENIEKIGQADSVETMYADGAVEEFRTNSGTLSTWEIQSLEQIDDEVLAILVTSSDITKMDIVIINTKLLDTNGLLYNRTYAGQDIAVPDLQDTHFDILDITIPKLINCSKVFKQIYIDDNDEGKLIVRYAIGELKDLLIKANENKRIKLELLNPKMKKVLNAS